MKTQIAPRRVSPRLVGGMTALYATLAFGFAALGQGTITFNGAAGLSSDYYRESGMWFQLVIPPGTSGRDYMAVIAGAGNTPRDGTDFMGWFQTYNPYDYVELSLTNGSTFGLASIWLADPIGPSPSPVSISFVGNLATGLSVTNTFTTPGGGATTFATYAFNSDFASGLTSVDILADRWAMDNLVFTVPEPSSIVLAGLGFIVLAVRSTRRRDKASASHPELGAR